MISAGLWNMQKFSNGYGLWVPSAESTFRLFDLINLKQCSYGRQDYIEMLHKVIFWFVYIWLTWSCISQIVDVYILD